MIFIHISEQKCWSEINPHSVLILTYNTPKLYGDERGGRRKEGTEVEGGMGNLLHHLWGGRIDAPDCDLCCADRDDTCVKPKTAVSR